MIYFIQAPDGGPVKIGYTANLKVRLKKLEYHYGRTLTVLATMDGDRDEERRIHSRFGHLRLYGEQFRPSPELLAFIGQPSASSLTLQVIEPMAKTGFITTILARRAWKEWLNRLAAHDADGRRAQTNVSDTVDQALVAYARTIGFKEAAPKR